MPVLTDAQTIGLLRAELATTRLALAAEHLELTEAHQARQRAVRSCEDIRARARRPCPTCAARREDVAQMMGRAS